MTTGYGVRIVGDDALPADVDWMFVKQSNGALTLYMSKSAAGCARALSEAWAAYRAMSGTATYPKVPTQRGPLRLNGLSL